jgi:hypothetical protein
MRLSTAASAVMAILAGLALIEAQPQAASSISVQRNGAVEIAGRSMSCGSVRSQLDSGLQNLGISIPDRGLIVINPALLRRQPETVRLFVFTHECGHHYVGGSELGADCWAVRRGLREGWLTKDGLRQVCGSFGNAPETPTHPSAARRCSNLNRCFASELAAIEKEQEKERAKVAAPQPAQASEGVSAAAGYEASPRLTSEPKLVRTGKPH